MNFEELQSKWNWSPIRNCPGRFVWRESDKTVSPERLVGTETRLQRFRVEQAKDAVVAVRIDGGGLISYQKEDGTYLHTLNTIEGFERKLSQLRISL